MKAHSVAFGDASLKKGFACALSTLRRGGRVAEGARLESVYAGNRIAGSNPAPSARIISPKPLKLQRNQPIGGSFFLLCSLPILYL